jgi:ParB-like chromosome segregation protein Spo0J
MQFHELANVFPLIEGDEFAGLVADIGKQGLLEAIVLLDGKILDGRNRYRACLEAGVEPHFEEFDGEDPVAFVVSKNVARRHLDESQRAMAAARIATLQNGQRKSASPIGEGRSQAEAAQILNVGKRSVERARDVLDQGEETLVKAVEQGKVSVSAAADVATLPRQEQAEIVAKGEKEILEAAKRIRLQKAEVRRLEREHPIPKKTLIREWADSILFAVFAAHFIRLFLIEAYTIPTPSMEGSLLVGDYLFVSKVHYGSRMPMTPISSPSTASGIFVLSCIESPLGPNDGANLP